MKLSWLILFGLVSIAGLTVYLDWQAKEDRLLEHHVQMLSSGYQTSLNVYHRIAQTIYDEAITRPEVLQTIDDAYRATPQRQAILRLQLMKLLTPTYERIKQLGFIHFQFHFPNSSSFLRFHKPEVWGDSLLDVRPSVVQVNREKKQVMGLETGKHLHSIRYIFPLFNAGHHIGSVETALGLNAVQEAISHPNQDMEYLFMLHRDFHIAEKYWGTDAYEPVDFALDYMLAEVAGSGLSQHDRLSPGIVGANSILATRQDVSGLMAQGEKFSVYLGENNQGYNLVSFLPLKNITGERSAYLLAYERSPELDALWQDFYRLLFALGLFLLAMVYLLRKWLKSTRKSLDNERKFRAITDHMSDCLYVNDDQGKIVFCNETMCRILQYSQEELLDQDAHELLHQHPEDEDKAKPSSCHVLNSTLSGTHFESDKHSFKCKDGNRIPIELKSAPLVLESSKRHSVVLFKDITERKRVEREMLQAKEMAESLSRAKSHFLATMSHEIRTPMNGVLGMTELLADTPLDSGQRDYVMTLMRSGRSLLQIINDLLDFSKLEAEKVELESIPFDLERLALDSLELLSTKAAEKGVELILDYDPACPHHVLGDPGRLGQVLTNLVSNAVKFTDKGYIRLGVMQEQTMSSQGVHLLVQVEDTGIGVTPKQQERIFDSFSQADESTTRVYGGTGLGLSICKRLVDLMGGQIGIDSVPGQGATFWFKLVLAQSAPPKELSHSALHGVRVLVMDSQLQNRKVIERQLKYLGAMVELLESSAQVIPRLCSAEDSGEPFQLLLLDHHMPVTNGIQLGRDVRSQRGFEGLRLVLLSSMGEKGEAKQIQAIGFDAYLNKPILSETLKEVLGAALMRQPGDPILTRHSVLESTMVHSEKRRFKGRVVLVEDVLANQKVASVMLEKMGLEVVSAENGIEAVDRFEPGKFDLIFMDCRMPIMDGYAATKAIRSKERNTRIPIIALTANTDLEDRMHCLEAGMDDFVTKPFRKETLVSCLETWLGSEHYSMEIDKAEVHAKLDEAPEQPIDPIVLKRLRNDTGEDFGEVMQAIRVSMQDILAELGQRLSEMETEEIVRHAHSLKSPCANLGAQRMFEMAARLEHTAEQCTGNELVAGVEQLQQEFQEVRKAIDRLDKAS